MRGQYILILALCYGVGSPATQAQTIYRCGNSYSQTPCPGGSVVGPESRHDTTRDKTQEQARKTQEALTRRDMQLANELEKSRLRQEAAQSRTQRATRAPAAYDAVSEDYDEARAEPRKKSPYFTARAATEPKSRPGEDKKSSTKSGATATRP